MKMVSRSSSIRPSTRPVSTTQSGGGTGPSTTDFGRLVGKDGPVNADFYRLIQGGTNPQARWTPTAWAIDRRTTIQWVTAAGRTGARFSPIGRFELAKDLIVAAGRIATRAAEFNPSNLTVTLYNVCLPQGITGWTDGILLGTCLTGQAGSANNRWPTLRDAVVFESYPFNTASNFRYFNGMSRYTTGTGAIRYRTVESYQQPETVQKPITAWPRPQGGGWTPKPWSWGPGPGNLPAGLPPAAAKPLNEGSPLVTGRTVTQPRPPRPPPVIPVKPHTKEPPGPGEKERKARLRSFAALALKGVHLFSETMDYLDATWDALPKDCKTKPAKPNTKIADIYRCWEHIDLSELMFNLLWNHFSDYIIGAKVFGGMDGFRKKHGIDMFTDVLGNIDGGDQPYEEALAEAIKAAHKKLKKAWDSGANLFDDLPPGLVTYVGNGGG